MDFARCSENSRQPYVVVTENKRTFRITNPNREKIKTILVDGCLIDDARIRCDYAFEIGPSSDCAIYVELKGSDISRAFAQLAATIGYLAQRHKAKRKVCHIVASRVPRAGPKVQVLKVEMQRTHNASLYVSTQEVTIDLRKDPYRTT